MLRQVLAIAGLNLRTLPQRWGSSLVVLVSLAGTAGVLVAVLAMAEGFSNVLANTGRPDRVIVLKTGAPNEGGSQITREEAGLILDIPGVARDSEGKALALVERIFVSILPRKTGKEANVLVRGVGGEVAKVRPEFQLLEGRMFTSGLREIVVGRAVHGLFRGLEVGSEVPLGAGIWTVVGVFQTGDVHDSEVWGDLEAIMTTFRRQTFMSITLRLNSPDDFTTVKDALGTNPRLSHTAHREPDYFASQTGGLYEQIRILGYGVSAIMALGALFAAVNSMFAAVRARTVEIGTLRAIGFGAMPIVVSILIEALVLCATGALVGGAIAFLLFNGYTVSTLHGQTFSQVAFPFRVSSLLVAEGVAWSCLVGLIGGLPPALRAVRRPITDVLHVG